MPNQNITVPHLAVPFRFKEGSAVCVEQDSPDEVSQCVANIMRTPRGFRLEIPDFGVNLALQEGGPSIPQIEAAIRTWEPRADFVLNQRQLEDILSSVLEIQVGVQ